MLTKAYEESTISRTNPTQIFFNTTTVTYALAYFLPIILTENMGFSVGASQCLVAPPYALAAIVMYTTGYLGDKYRIRGPIIICNMVLCLIGLPIMGWHKSSSVRYVSPEPGLCSSFGLTLAKVLWRLPSTLR